MFVVFLHRCAQGSFNLMLVQFTNIYKLAYQHGHLVYECITRINTKRLSIYEEFGLNKRTNQQVFQNRCIHFLFVFFYIILCSFLFVHN